MLLNRAPKALVKRPPSVSLDWQTRLEEWLSIALSSNFQRVFELQREMLDVVIAIETDIRSAQAKRKAHKSDIPDLKAAGEYNRIREVQRIVSSLENDISALQYLRDCTLFVGDTIASKILDVDTIKQMAAFQAPGFLSGKDGLDYEIDAAERFYREGWMVLFNDLTHSVRIGDLTLKKGDVTKTFEVKASPEAYASQDAARQIVTPILIHDYIKNDWSPYPTVLQENSDIASRGAIARGATRVSSGIDEDWHFEVPGELYRGVRRSEVAVVHKGCKHYLAARGRNSEQLLETVSNLTSRGDWIAGSVRTRVVEYGDVPPFSRWLKPESTVEVISGDMIIIAAINLQGLADLFSKSLVEIEWGKKCDDLLPIKFTPKFETDPKYQVQQVNICNWHRLKVLYAFCAAETFAHICAFMLSPAAVKQLEEKRGQ